MSHKKYRTYVFRGLPLISDSRTTRYGEILENVTYCTWEKKKKSTLPNVSHIVAPVSKDGRGFYIRYFIYLLHLTYLGFTKIKSGDVCICMDIDTFLPVWIATRFRHVVVAFDVVDPASQARFKNIPAKKFIDNIEYACIKLADLCIFPHDCRITYYSPRETSSVHNKAIVIENVPLIAPQDFSIQDRKKTLSIGYFGTLDGTRGLDIIIGLAKKNKDTIELIIAGDGPESKYVTSESNNSANIVYLGRYIPAALPGLYERIDFSWAYYAPNVDLHKFAAPNKFYEHLCFNKPIIINDIIPQQIFVKQHSSGIVLAEQEILDIQKGNDSDFIRKINQFQRRDLRGLWDELYENYYHRKKIELNLSINIIRIS
ncbi:MAG: hypothetical protein ACOH2I_14785 [Pseudomonas sp.]